jgi:hypothetical protein
MRVRGTRQQGNRRGRPAGSGFGLQQDPTRFKTENGLQRDRKSRKVAGSLSADVESGGRWKMQEGGIAADCRLVTQIFVLPFN